MTTNKRITSFTSYGRKAGSARVRVFDWIDHIGLPATSYTYLDGSSNSPKQLLRDPRGVLSAELALRNASRSPLGSTIISRQATPFSNGHIEKRLLQKADWGVYDFDDALMLAPAGASARLWSKQKIWRSSVQAADRVIAGNEFLANHAARVNANVTIIPSCVEPEHYVRKSEFAIGEAPVAVWIGSPSTEKYLTDISDALTELHRKLGLRLLLISSGNASLGKLDSMVDRREWNAATFGRDLAEADFGIMPLDDSAWERGKCAYKLLQYAAAGLPLVGSPVGSNKSLLKAATGFAPSGRAEWVDAIAELLGEPEINRMRRGETGRREIETHYSFNAWRSVWLEAMGISC